MALVWHKTVAGTRYEVRRAGNSVRLFTDGIFHSQWNSVNPIGGQLWELLFLPVMFHSRPLALKKVLVLGVGGGAVINLLNQYCKPQNIIGVELDKTHIQIAKRWFNAHQSNTTYEHADAESWVKARQNLKFDLIIEDLFKSDGDCEPVRAIDANQAWLSSLDRMLNKDGLLVMNFESIKQARKSWSSSLKNMNFTQGRIFNSIKYDNAIGIFGRQKLNMAEFKQNLSIFPDLDMRRLSCKLDFKCRVLS